MEVYVLMAHHHLVEANWDSNEPGLPQGDYICEIFRTPEKAEQELERRIAGLCKSQGVRRDGNIVRRKFTDGIDKVIAYYIQRSYMND